MLKQEDYTTRIAIDEDDPVPADELSEQERKEISETMYKHNKQFWEEKLSKREVVA